MTIYLILVLTTTNNMTTTKQILYSTVKRLNIVANEIVNKITQIEISREVTENVNKITNLELYTRMAKDTIQFKNSISGKKLLDHHQLSLLEKI